MHKIKVVAKRGSALLGAAGLLLGIGASALPAFASADALNPLTQRSLALSSSSPGWSYTDGSGNTTYAYPGSGANGKQTSNFYSFNVSSAKSINALTFQYCINPAGDCVDPGNDSTHGTDTASTSDLQVKTGTGAGNTPVEITSSDWTTIAARTEANAPTSGGVKLAHAYAPKMDNSEGNFVVLVNGAYSGGWAMSASNQEEASGATTSVTGNPNMITLINNDVNNANPTNGVALSSNDHIEVKFFATNTNYITNPGTGAFFVKINDYEIPVSGSAGALAPTAPTTDANPISGNANIIDGGVTVANVMNESIEIQTKVLETMQFSVGTVDPDTLTTTELATATSNAVTAHGSCDNILPSMSPTGSHNVLLLGDPTNEHALSTQNTYGTHSYWRLSSNSSAGASVYYAGSTLHDTEGDDINAIGTTAAAPQIGSEQFGLAIDNDANTTDMTFASGVPNGDNDHFGVNADNAQNTDGTSASYDYGEDNGTTMNGVLDNVSGASGADDWLNHGVKVMGGHNPQLYPLVAQAPYSLGGFQSGTLSGSNSSVFNPALTGGTYNFNSNLRFAFDPDANTHPALLATENNQVVDCVTAKMRYIANVAAITPAGIYTTKINYIAAPQY